MKFVRQVQPSDVVFFATRLVKRAKMEVFMTMDMVEESRNPLPQTYHRLVSLKAAGGISVIRYGYGPKTLFRQLSKTFADIHFRYGGSLSGYQRMLLVDKRYGLFRIGDRIYYTTVTELVSALRVFAEGTV